MSSFEPALAEQQAYTSIMKGLAEMDLSGSSVPCHLSITGDHAFPLVMNCKGQVLMAASTYGSGRIVVVGHESYLVKFPKFVENALQWLKGDQAVNMSVGVHASLKNVAENLSNTRFQAKVVRSFSSDEGFAVHVTDAYSVEGKEKDLVAFLKSGGGVLMGGQAWWWASQHPHDNILLQFSGNRVSGVAGIYFTEHHRQGECLAVDPQIPHSWRTLKVCKDFKDDLEFLLQGVTEFDIGNGTFSEIFIYGPLSFPITTRPEGGALIAGGYYRKGRVIVVSHEALLGKTKLAPFWKNAVHWLDQGRLGVIGVEANMAFSILSESGLNCQKTGFKQGLSVFVRTVYGGDHIKEIQEFVAEGGGLLIGGHAWYWAQTHPGQNCLTEFSGNKILNAMGFTLLPRTVGGGLFQAPDPSTVIKDNYHFRHLLYRFAKHVTENKQINPHEEKCLKKLGADCATILTMNNYDGCSHLQLVCVLTKILKKTGVPQVSEQSPVSSPKDHLLLSLASAVYKVCPNPEELVGYFIKDNPLLPALYNHEVKIDVDTADREEWISTGLYLSPGMKTYMSMPPKIINKGWKVQIGCQTDRLTAAVIKRAPYVCEMFPVTSEMMLVHNLWGGLIYLIAPPKTQFKGLKVIVQVGVPAPYYKSGETSLSEWSVLRTAPSPWAELEFENIVLTVPSEVVRGLERPDELAALWDRIMRAVADLAAIPPKFKRKERFLCDVQISHGWMHAGYPVMANKSSAAGLVSVKHITTTGLWGAIHELGHNQQRGCWEFPSHTTEATCNLWSVYVHETVLNIPREKAHEQMRLDRRNQRAENYAKNGRKLNEWSVWVALETYMQDCTPTSSSNLFIKFEDDTTVLGHIHNNDETSCRSEVNSLATWCKDNNLHLNVEKTKEIVVDFRRAHIQHAPLTINGAAVERVSSTKFLGVHISEDLSWSSNSASLAKRAQQRLYFLCKLKRARAPAPILRTFYRGTIESILSSCITVWYGSCTVSCKKTLQRIVRAAERIIGVPLPSLLDIYHSRLTRKATRIAGDPTHPSHSLFSLLPSGRRLRSLQARTSRLRDSFFHQAVRRLNSLPALPSLLPSAPPQPPVTH